MRCAAAEILLLRVGRAYPSGLRFDHELLHGSELASVATCLGGTKPISEVRCEERGTSNGLDPV